MPHIWNNIYVATFQEVQPWYNSLKTLQSEIDRHKEKEYGIKKVCSGGNGRQLLVAYDSLPQEIKNALGDPRKAEHLMERFYKTDADAVRFYAQHKIEGVHLSSKLQEEYITNASVLRACVLLKQARESERRSKGKFTMKGIMNTICGDAHGFNTTLQMKHHVKHTLPSSERRFKDAFNEFNKPFKADDAQYAFNYPSLISGRVGNQNTRKVTEDVMHLLNALFAGRKHKPSRTEVSRCYDGFLQGYIEVMNEETAELYNPKDFKPLSDSTIISYLSAWSEAIGTEYKRGNNVIHLKQKFEPYHSLKKPLYASSLISVDDRQPPFEYEKGKRAWFYLAFDIHSHCFTTWVYGKSKEGIITEFYRQIVRLYTHFGFHLPIGIEAEMNLNAPLTKTFLREGVMFDDVRLEPNNPRGKIIERQFKELRYDVEKGREGWIPRPFALNEANQTTGSTKDTIIPYGDIVELALKDIDDWNNQPHPVYKTKSRWQVFCENQHPNLKPTNWRSLLPHLGFCSTTSVGYNGILRLQGGEYLLGDNGTVYTGQELIDAMEMVAGENVKVYWLDDIKGDVLKAVICFNDTIICEAVRKPIYNRAKVDRTPQDEAARQVMSEYEATIMAYGRDKRRSIPDVMVIDNTPNVLPRTFVMPGIQRYEAPEDTPELLPEIMEQETDYMDMPVSSNQSFVKPLKDRI